MRRLRLFPGPVLALAAALAAGVATCCGAGAASVAGATLTAASTPAAVISLAAARTPAVCSSAAHPRLAAAISRGILDALAGRSSVVGIDADDPAVKISCQYHARWNFASASVVKVIILGTLLRELQARHEHIGPGQAALARAMITESDNDAATALWNDVGLGGLQSFLDAAGMTHTRLAESGFWGLTQVNAHDELLLLRLLVTPNKVLDRSSRAYALMLMADVIASQRWGTPAGAPADVTVHVKNGWLPDPSLWVINSIGDFTHHGSAYSIAILTRDNPSMAYGVATVAAVAFRINRALAGYTRWAAHHCRRSC